MGLGTYFHVLGPSKLVWLWLNMNQEMYLYLGMCTLLNGYFNADFPLKNGFVFGNDIQIKEKGGPMLGDPNLSFEIVFNF
jgi:hypothetical protein